MTRYELIDSLREQDDFSLVEMCEALEVSRSGFYAWQKRPASAREIENRQLLEVMREVHAHRHTKAYGSPRMAEELHDRGLAAGENRVARLMRKEGLRAQTKRAFKPKTTLQDAGASSRIAPNRLAEMEEISAPGQALAGDITYVATREGWLYLAVVIDLFSRCILGWKFSESLTTPLVTGALERARRNPMVAANGLFHSDRGCQYTSKAFIDQLAAGNLLPSMSATGYCYDNARCESFFATLKAEGFPQSLVFNTKAEAQLAIFDYIETFYNRRRKHSSLGYLSPEQYLQQYHHSLN